MYVLGDTFKFRTENSNMELDGHVYHVDCMDMRKGVVYHVSTPIGQCFKVRQHQIIEPTAQEDAKKELWVEQPQQAPSDEKPKGKKR